MEDKSVRSSGETPKPKETLHIDDVGQLRALADPFRLELLQAMGEDPIAVKDIAKRLGEKQQRLYYHVNGLEEAGLIVQVDSRIVSGIVEKVFQVAARRIEVSPELFSGGTAGEDAAALVASLFDNAKRMLHRALDAGVARISPNDSSQDLSADSRDTVFTSVVVRLGSDRAARLKKNLETILDEATAGGTNAEPDVKEYALMTLFHPVAKQGDV